ncbi:mediator of RNA polymerase II transcription subunit 15A isoform X1 [Tanacetum coccineum]
MLPMKQYRREDQANCRGDTHPGGHGRRDNLKGKARQGFFPGRLSLATCLAVVPHRSAISSSSAPPLPATNLSFSTSPELWCIEAGGVRGRNEEISGSRPVVPTTPEQSDRDPAARYDSVLCSCFGDFGGSGLVPGIIPKGNLGIPICRAFGDAAGLLPHYYLPSAGNCSGGGQVKLEMDIQGSSGGPEGDPSMESGDWRVQLQPDSRERIVNKILETLKRNCPFPYQETLQELKGMAMRFEENIYTTATSQHDYLRTISLKMLTIETRSQNPMPDAMQANNVVNLLDPGSMASGHQAPSISDMAIDNVSSGGPKGYQSMESGLNPKKMETLKRNSPFLDQEAQGNSYAVSREDFYYCDKPGRMASGHQAPSISDMAMYHVSSGGPMEPSDYLRTVSLRMLTMETISQNPMPNAMQANNGLNPLDPGNVARGYQAPSVSDMARDNVSCPSGGTHSYSHDQSAPIWNTLNKRDSSPMNQ